MAIFAQNSKKCVIMSPIRNFDAMVTRLLSQASAPVRVAVVCPDDEATVEAVARGLSLGIIACRLYCKAPAALPAALRDYAASCTVVECADADEAARAAVADVRECRADVLMKGLINTDNLLRAVLDKQHGLLPPGGVMSHLTVMQVPGYDKLLFMSDVAVIPFPTAVQRAAMVGYVADACRALGIERPRMALVHCTEKTSPKFPVTLDYADIVARAAAGEWGDVAVAGPMDVKTACDSHSARVKGLTSEVCGHADALIFPDIEAGNVFYKTMTCFAGAETAGVLTGTMAPVVVPSRSDDARSKFASLALAALTGRR